MIQNLVEKEEKRRVKIIPNRNFGVRRHSSTDTYGDTIQKPDPQAIAVQNN